MFYVYILQSAKDKKLYIGFSTDINQRFKKHKEGDTKSTRPRRPLKLIYSEAHISEKDARRRERYFKTTKGKSSLRQILRDTLNPDN